MALSFGPGRDDLRWSVHPWHTIANDVPMAVIITNSEGVVTTWSPEAERLYQWPAAEAVGVNIQQLTVGPTLADTAEQIMTTVLQGEAWEGEFTARRRDGSSIDVHVIDLPVMDAEGHIAGIVGLSFDVSQPRATLRAEVDRIAEITAWVSRARLDERQRIGRDLHDELGQLLTVLRTELLRSGDPPDHIPTIEVSSLVDLVDACLGEVRRICHDLRRDPLDLAGLAARVERATRELAQRTGLIVSFSMDPSVMRAATPVLVWPTVVNTAWHIVQEALTNVERHADATTTTVWLGLEGAQLVGRVSDDGVGIWSLGEATLHGMGLNSMGERARAVHGEVQVVSARGTTVSFRLPLAPRP